MNTQVFNKTKAATQKGFTFVELLIIMIVVAILSGIGIQFVLSTQEDKAKLTNSKNFIAKDIPTAMYSCILRTNSLNTCDEDALIAENLDSLTEWGDTWTASQTTGATEALTVCYPLDKVGTRDESRAIGNSIGSYLSAETTWFDNGSTYTFLGTGVATVTVSPFAGCADDNFAIQFVTRN